ncbi:unnamed protein product [Pleuronectes platessa]|uniref:Uncharacterized protein n=1 Tax=Pleuronectes platessa TaxID=8262 RepID=A0A9N7UJE8_PLEPL|nr:unnamed protein product [Pleuronectes platessa]
MSELEWGCSNPFEGNRLAPGGPCNLQRRSAVGGPSPLQPSHRHQPTAPSADRYLGGCWARGGPRSLQKGYGVGGGRWRGGIHSRSLSLQKPTHRHQPPPAQTGSKPVLVQLQRAPAHATPVLVLEVLAAPVHSLSQAGGSRLTSFLFWHRRSSWLLLQSLPHAGGSRLTSFLFWRGRSSRRLLQSLSQAGGSRLTSFLFWRGRSSRRLLQSLSHAGGPRQTHSFSGIRGLHGTCSSPCPTLEVLG